MDLAITGGAQLSFVAVPSCWSQAFWPCPTTIGASRLSERRAIDETPFLALLTLALSSQSAPKNRPEPRAPRTLRAWRPNLCPGARTPRRGKPRRPSSAGVALHGLCGRSKRHHRRAARGKPRWRRLLRGAGEHLFSERSSQPCGGPHQSLPGPSRPLSSPSGARAGHRPWPRASG